MSGPTDQLVQRILAAFANEGDQRAARLLAEARAEAENEIRALLKSAMKAALLQQAAAQLDRLEPPPQLHEPTAAEPRGVEPRGAEPLANVELACYVYAIARDAPDESRLPPGVDPAHPPRVVRHRGLHAIVSDVPLGDFGQAALDRRVADVEWIGQRVRAHDAVVKAAGAGAGGGAAVIPLRFCTVVRDEHDVRRVLDAHHARVAEILENLRGKVEWGVKVRFAQPAHARPVHADEPDSGRAYLVRQKHRAPGGTPRAARDTAEECHRQLAALAHDAATLPLKHHAEANGAAGAQVVLNAAYLVGDDDAHAFHETVRALNERHAADGITLEPTGPWPAYNFVSLDLSLEGAA